MPGSGEFSSFMKNRKIFGGCSQTVNLSFRAWSRTDTLGR